jgi:hypothetical protein
MIPLEKDLHPFTLREYVCNMFVTIFMLTGAVLQSLLVVSWWKLRHRDVAILIILVDLSTCLTIGPMAAAFACGNGFMGSGMGIP